MSNGGIVVHTTLICKIQKHIFELYINKIMSKIISKNN